MEKTAAEVLVNNDIYDTLGERWYSAFDDPVALLRAESKLRNPWILKVIRSHLGGTNGDSTSPLKVLDVGCGGGFLTNFLALNGLDVTGVDQSSASLHIAHRHDATGRVCYKDADAAKLPYGDASFDVVCAMDFLEHVEDPMALIKEMARVLKPNGIFFFHTFNRNVIAWLVIIKFVEWFVKNTPKNMHILRLFIKPEEMTKGCEAAGLTVQEVLGTRPIVFRWSVLKGLLRRTVAQDFGFEFTPSTLLSYSGYAVKR